HKTKPNQAGIVFRCDCGTIRKSALTESCKHQCASTNFTVVSEADAALLPCIKRKPAKPREETQKEAMKCPLCNIGYYRLGTIISHLLNQHKTTPEKVYIFSLFGCPTISVAKSRIGYFSS
ncbi:hypothetical protein PFISCL1PPCAC_12454, partial [Pristionchus fissidentatus]